MSNSLIPAPDGAEPQKTGDEQSQRSSHGDGNARRRQQRQPKKPSIPSLEDCLLAFARLAGLVAMGLLKPAQASVIRAAYREILQYHTAKAKELEKGLSNADVLEFLRKDPKMLDLLAPLLTQEQIDMLMRDTEGNANGQA